MHQAAKRKKIDDAREAYANDEILSASSAGQVMNGYHESMCGSILLPLSTNNTREIFDILRHGNFDRFRRCLEVYYKEIIEMKNEIGQTILHILTIHAYPYKWIRLLMMRECNLCSQDNHGYTAAHYAVERDDVETLKALTTKLSLGNQVLSSEQITTIHKQALKSLTVRQNQGLTAFMLACYRQSFKCLDYLIQLEVNDVHLQDNFGDTCLHYAVARKNSILAEKLINECQADVNAGEKSRPSVLDIAQFNIDQTIETLLLEHDARNRCRIKRIVRPMKDVDQMVIDNLVCVIENSSKTNEQSILTTEK